ncbi:MAG: hypothetical protein NVSMB25_22570 [Thermoleophilaceae bacterium]
MATAGCGSQQRKQAAGGPPRLVAALGDSITAGSPRWDPSPEVRATLGADANPESEFEYWAQLALAGTAVFRNCGVFGERTDEIASRLDGCARGATTLIVQGGINDIAQGVGPEVAAANLERMVARGRALHERVLLAEVLPWNNGPPAARRRIEALNRAIDALGARARVTVLPFHAALEDRGAPGRLRRDLTVEGDHPSVSGYRILGRLVAEALRP